jgi:uncharacterized CHY-type Zn-finger protein
MVKGNLIDEQTRCVHWHTSLDIIAIKFKCCNTYYACYDCHYELAGHKPQEWTKDERKEKAILCGACKTELTIQEYFDSGNFCPHCKSAFNPNCNRHYHLYFEM